MPNKDRCLSVTLDLQTGALLDAEQQQKLEQEMLAPEVIELAQQGRHILVRKGDAEGVQALVRGRVQWPRKPPRKLREKLASQLEQIRGAKLQFLLDRRLSGSEPDVMTDLKPDRGPDRGPILSGLHATERLLEALPSVPEAALTAIADALEAGLGASELLRKTAFEKVVPARAAQRRKARSAERSRRWQQEVDQLLRHTTTIGPRQAAQKIYSYLPLGAKTWRTVYNAIRPLWPDPLET
jgi:hypothetical protein